MIGFVVLHLDCGCTVEVPDYPADCNPWLVGDGTFCDVHQGYHLVKTIGR